MPKRFILSLVIASIAGGLLTTMTDKREFEELVKRTITAERASSPGTKCPLSREYIDSGDLDLISVCMKYGLVAYDAAQRYPTSASKIFAMFGEEPTFQEVLDRYGHQVIPVVAYFVDNGSMQYQFRQAFGTVLRQVWEGQMPNWEAGSLAREQIGLLAIYEIADRGQELLAEFVIVDGLAKRKPLTTVVFGAKDFFLGGAQNLETVLVRGERLPSWGEVGLAALDTTVIVGGVGALAKEVRVAELAVAERSTGLLLVENAYRAIRTVGKVSVPVGGIAVLYVAVTRPWLIASAGGWVAEQLGYDRRIGIFVVYFVAFELVFVMLLPLYWYVSAIRRVSRLLRLRRWFNRETPDVPA